MKKAASLSAFIGTSFVALCLTLLKFLQPVSRVHLVLLSYFILLSSLISGVCSYRRAYRERNLLREKIAARRIPVEIETKSGERIAGLLCDVAHGMLILENCKKGVEVCEELILPLTEVKTLKAR